MLAGVAAKGETVVVTSWRAGRWALVEIADGKSAVLLADEAVKHSPRFGDSADEIYFIADYGKVYNVWSWRRDRPQLARWTQAPFGVLEMSAPVGGEMLLTTIEADGDILRRHRLAQAPMERREPAASAAPRESSTPPAPASTPAPDVADRTYWPFSSMLPRWWLPQGYSADGALALGAYTQGEDALGLHQYGLAPLYEITQHELLGSAYYVYDGRHGAVVNRQMTVRESHDDADGGGRKVDAYSIQESAQWISTWRHLSLNSRFYWGLGAALDREHFYRVDISRTSVRDERVAGLVAGVDTRRLQRLGEGPTQGQQLRLFAETSNGLHGAFSGNVYRSDWRVFFPLGKTVLSGRWNEVYAQPEAEAIELGGTLSEEPLSYALPLLNQRRFALRGYRVGEPDLTGHRARLGTIEWRTPLADIDRNTMVPPVGVNRLSMNVFVDVGAAWDSGEQRHYRRGVGIELMSELRAGYLGPLQLRFGVARGIDETGRTVGYVQLGRSF
jgi:hypothetical protein